MGKRKVFTVNDGSNPSLFAKKNEQLAEWIRHKYLKLANTKKILLNYSHNIMAIFFA